MLNYCRNALCKGWDSSRLPSCSPSAVTSAFSSHYLLSLPSLPELQHWACWRDCSRFVNRSGNLCYVLPGLRQIWGLSFHGINNYNSDKNEVKYIFIDVRPSEYYMPCIRLQEAEGWTCKPRKREIQNPGKGSKGKAQDYSGSAGLEGKKYWLDQRVEVSGGMNVSIEKSEQI